MEKIYILDASAFIMGLFPSMLEQNSLTTSEVAQELGGERFNEKYSAVLYIGKLRIISPSEECRKVVQKVSVDSGDRMKLSKADVSVLALALELKGQGSDPILVSDDFAVQNVAEQLNVNYVHLSIFGIKSQIKWIWYCPACRRIMSKDFCGKICPTCGTKVKRKAFKKSALNIKRKPPHIAKGLKPHI
jgi:UPF0271 protein